MMLPSSLLATIFLLTSTTFADDGQWHPSQYGGAAVAVSPTVQTMPLDTTAATPSMPAVVATPKKGSVAVASQAVTTPVVVASATGGWESQVTWPAGCESWANPCPPGAIISGGGIAGYTNGFTSYTTETDSNGVITGMPPKATVAAGVSEAGASTLVISTRASSNSTFSSRAPSSTQSGFSTGASDSPLQSNGAGSLAIFGSSTLIVAAAALALLC